MRRCKQTRGCVQHGGHKGACMNSRGHLIPPVKPVEVRVVGARSHRTGKALWFRKFFVFSTGTKRK